MRRAHVTVDAAGLCLKAGNAAILRGGSEAIRCNRALAALVHEGLREAGLPAAAVQVGASEDQQFNLLIVRTKLSCFTY